MPKQRITKEIVVNAAFELLRNDGIEKITSRNIADEIGCSVQPIYSYCRNMEGLQQNIFERVKEFIQTYIESHIYEKNMFEGIGQAYLQIAREEPHLFKFFILHPRKGVSSLEDIYRAETNPDVEKYVARQLNISILQAKQLHLNMLIYTIGIGTIFSVTSPGISTDEIFKQQKIAYDAFLKYTLENMEE